MGVKARPVKDRILERCELAASGCWMWTGSVSTDGYGCITIRSGRSKKTTFRTHRIAYEELIGPIPIGLWVLHKCDEPRCCNPKHLFLGDAKANAVDRQKKSRGRKQNGSLHHNARFTEADIPIIRRQRLDGKSIAQLAREWNVTFMTISTICSRRHWKHVP